MTSRKHMKLVEQAKKILSEEFGCIDVKTGHILTVYGHHFEVDAFGVSPEGKSVVIECGHAIHDPDIISEVADEFYILTYHGILFRWLGKGNWKKIKEYPECRFRKKRGDLEKPTGIEINWLDKLRKVR